MSNPSKPLPKRKAPAFKPPRPAAKAQATPTPGASRRKSAPARPAASSSATSSSAEEPATIRSSSPEEPDSGLSTNTKAVSLNPPPLIPPNLLARILHHNFEGEDQQVRREAILLVGKYMDTFVREAIARATYERAAAGGGGVGSDFLEVNETLNPWD